MKDGWLRDFVSRTAVQVRSVLFEASYSASYSFNIKSSSARRSDVSALYDVWQAAHSMSFLWVLIFTLEAFPGS